MLTQYKNIQQIKTTNKSVTGQRFTDVENALLKYPIFTRKYPVINELTNSNNASKIELHLYSNDTWITGNHSVQPQSQLPTFINKTTNQQIQLKNPIAIDLRDELDKLNIAAGQFTVVVNFFENLIGNYNHQYLAIDEISTDRTELRLKPLDSNNAVYKSSIVNFINTVSQTTNTQDGAIKLYDTYLLNFSRNQCVEFVNSVVVDDYVYVKLREALPTQYEVNFKLWIVRELRHTYIDKIFIEPTINVTSTINAMAGPNWDAFASYNTSNETGLQSWTDILGSATQTSQQLVDTYFSGSLSGVELNINYTDFNNFIFYSSATERLENFKYKLELVEYYTSQSANISTISGSIAQTNAQDFNNLKTNLISGFDKFEQYLYYESASIFTTHNIPVIDAVVPDLTGSYVTPVPKTTTSKPYTLASVNSNVFKSWYTNLYESASLYDRLNLNALIYAIPEYIRFNSQNEQLSTFVNMLGHHYDILYTYIHHMNSLNRREENPKLGMPKELLYSVAKQFGWTLTDGRQSQELWEYVLGTTETGTPYTGSLTVGDPAVSGRDITYATWRRIVNNLPLLLKSKGTKRSVQALLACYGIPQSLISIHEFGGPVVSTPPLYEKLNSNYALNVSGSTAGVVTVNYPASINSFELRFRVDNVETNPLIPSTMNLATVGSNVFTIDFVSGNKGTVSINGVATQPMELFDGQWVSMLARNNGASCDLLVKKSKYGKIISAVSASDSAPFTGAGTVTLGGIAGGSRFVGLLQELRLWSSSLQDSAFNNHVKAPGAYNGNTDTYSELLFRLPLTQKINHAVTSSVMGSQPISSSISASFTGWSVSTPYQSIEETYYYDSVSNGITYNDNKIRLESNELVGTLDVKTRAERSQFDRASLDSNKIGIYFSPQTMIDEDIISQLGFVDLDSYIGDPGQTNAKSYPELIQYANQYWRKYSQRNDINAYIQMFTLFDMSFFKQLEQVLPARVNKITGLVIQPNILERSKDTILPTLSYENFAYETQITGNIAFIDSEYISYTASIETGNILSCSLQSDYTAFLTGSDTQRYDSVPYSYQYLLLSGSTWITASSPYWLSEAISPTILSSSVSDFLQFRVINANTASLIPADIQEFLPRGIQNQRYSGCKMSSPNFNVNSTQTVDGGPVVQIFTVNPNQLVYQTPGATGNFTLV